MIQRLFENLKLAKGHRSFILQSKTAHNIHSCERCGSTKVGKTLHHAYTRGWNDWCNQAVGDTGAYCDTCGWVTFVRTIDEFKKSLPDWCHAFNH